MPVFGVGGGTLEIKLIKYKNPEGKDINGRICDYWQWWKGCDHKFEFCLMESGNCIQPKKLSGIYDDSYLVIFNSEPKTHYTFTLKAVKMCEVFFNYIYLLYQ